MPCPRRGGRWWVPFIFWDQMGPAEFILGQGLDVRPHPAYRPRHRHLSVRGRDPASRQPGHAAADPARRRELDDRGPRHRPFGAQLARGARQRAAGCSASRPGWPCRRRPRRRHPTSRIMAATTLPVVSGEGKEVRIITGSLYGERSPVPTFSAMFYADAGWRRVPSCRCRPSTRSGRSMSPVGRWRWPATGSRPASSWCSGPGDEITLVAGEAGPPPAARRRAHGRAAPHLVELRLQPPGPDRAGQGRLAGRAVRRPSPGTTSSSRFPTAEGPAARSPGPPLRARPSRADLGSVALHDPIHQDPGGAGGLRCRRQAALQAVGTDPGARRLLARRN